MTSESRKLTEDVVTCGHCHNRSVMEALADADRSSFDCPGFGMTPPNGWVYSLLECQNCSEVTLRRVWVRDDDGEYGEPPAPYEYLYPRVAANPRGMPDRVARSYAAALKVRGVDANAFAVLLRRTLEFVCTDRGAKSGPLAMQLRELAERGEIPEKLVTVADGLRKLGNVGAHAGEGELPAAAVPAMHQLCNAILEYVYAAPALAEEAETLLAKATEPKQPKA